MELDDLKRPWQERDRLLEGAIPFRAWRVQASLLAKAETATRRLRRLLWYELIANVVAILWLGSFFGDHLTDARYAIPAGALGLCAIALLLAGVRQLVAIGQLDYGAPVVALQHRLASLKIERIRATTLTLLLAPLLWTPLLIVALKGLVGVDVYATFSTAWLIANLAFGLVVLVLGVVISRRYWQRMQEPSVQRLMRALAGNTLQTAEAYVRSVRRFETEEGRADHASM